MSAARTATAAGTRAPGTAPTRTHQGLPVLQAGPARDIRAPHGPPRHQPWEPLSPERVRTTTGASQRVNSLRAQVVQSLLGCLQFGAQLLHPGQLLGTRRVQDALDDLGDLRREQLRGLGHGGR